MDIREARTRQVLGWRCVGADTCSFDSIPAETLFFWNDPDKLQAPRPGRYHQDPKVWLWLDLSSPCKLWGKVGLPSKRGKKIVSLTRDVKSRTWTARCPGFLSPYRTLLLGVPPSSAEQSAAQLSTRAAPDQLLHCSERRNIAAGLLPGSEGPAGDYR